MLRFIITTGFILIFAYTLYTIAFNGIGFLPVFVTTLMAGDWNGQFALDFALYLGLSALWIAWRGGFSTRSCVMAACAGVLGMVVFAPYLLVLLRASNGDIATVLLGVHRRKT